MSLNKLEIRLYKPGDEHGIVKLFREIFGREMTLDEWKWKYIKSYPQKVYSSVAVHKELGIVGHYGGVCLPILYNGNSARGLTICDVMINPRFRGLKTLKELSWLVPHEAVKDGLIIGYGFPNMNTLLKPALKLGIYEKVEDVIEGSREAKFHNKLIRYNFKLFPLDYSDIRIDHLWKSCKNNLKLAVVRDRGYLSWRYKHHPLFTYELWGLRKRTGKRLYGLAVLRKEEQRVLVMDFLFTEGRIEPLLQKLENYVYSSGLKTLTCWAPPYMENTLRDNGFLIKPAGTSIPRTTHEKTLTKAQIKGNFFYTMGDTDFL